MYLCTYIGKYIYTSAYLALALRMKSPGRILQSRFMAIPRSRGRLIAFIIHLWIYVYTDTSKSKNNFFSYIDVNINIMQQIIAALNRYTYEDIHTYVYRYT